MFECAANTLRWANVEEVRLIDDVSIALPADGVPIGFVYLDDGKSRFYNEPFLAMIEARLMVGGVVAPTRTAKPTQRSHTRRRAIGGRRLPPRARCRSARTRDITTARRATELVSTGAAAHHDAQGRVSQARPHVGTGRATRGCRGRR